MAKQQSQIPHYEVASQAIQNPARQKVTDEAERRRVAHEAEQREIPDFGDDDKAREAWQEKETARLKALFEATSKV